MNKLGSILYWVGIILLCFFAAVWAIAIVTISWNAQPLLAVFVAAGVGGAICFFVGQSLKEL